MSMLPDDIEMTDVELEIMGYDPYTSLTTLKGSYVDHRGRPAQIAQFTMPVLMLSALVGPINPETEIGTTLDCQVPTVMLMNDDERREWTEGR